MPWYRREGKIETPITEQEFKEGMTNGYFVERYHRVYIILLYYTACRNGEINKAIRSQFRILPDKIVFDVGDRLKHSKKTPALPIPLNAPYVIELEDYIINLPRDQRLFTFTKRTGYNIVSRVFKYPHWFRLSRITWFFQQGFSIAEVRSWTGLTLRALDYYVGLTKIETMGNALNGKGRKQ